MNEHILKTDEPYFTAVKEGRKTFDARRNDRGYQTGDTLIFLDPANENHNDCASTCEDYQRGAIRRTVTFVFSGDPSLRDLGGIVPGYVILALAELPDSGSTRSEQ